MNYQGRHSLCPLADYIKTAGIKADGVAMDHVFRSYLHNSAVPVSGALETLEALAGKYIFCAATDRMSSS